MIAYERSYGTGRSVCSVLEFFGWVVVVFGILAAFVGVVSGGFLGAMSRGFGERDPHFMVRVIAMIPGLLMVVAGLISVTLAQQSRATLDTAEMTRDLLDLAKRQSLPSLRTSAVQDADPPFEDHETVVAAGREWRRTAAGGYTIIKGKGVGLTFGSIDELKAYLLENP
ncbi:hypothetical protein [Aquibium oceanicum]|uniref:Uncharacterized protein n=1 Tax=Aquibium oceanicum TaxID=1670800 RepID=A0A1L3SVH0_9HYPH|nr:hypothetical protein [Aquibium oceanicum]APH73426.1 hypothetical protein BSQ44_20160 [Aquibium oceanicum]